LPLGLSGNTRKPNVARATALSRIVVMLYKFRVGGRNTA
jgi:hypothetical protein